MDVMLCTRIRASASAGADRECRCPPPRSPSYGKGSATGKGKKKKFSLSGIGEGARKVIFSRYFPIALCTVHEEVQQRYTHYDHQGRMRRAWQTKAFYYSTTVHAPHSPRTDKSISIRLCTKRSRCTKSYCTTLWSTAQGDKP